MEIRRFKNGFTRGFTLAEVMIVLVVIGILTALLTPVIVKLKPNKTKIMFKKGYYVTERVISEMVNNETYYADSDATLPHFTDESLVTINGTDYSDDTKFCQLFASKVNTIGAPTCTAVASNYPTSAGNFTTTDGILWWVPTTVTGGNTTIFTTNAGTDPIRYIYMDINGKSATVTPDSPNCQYVSAAVCPNPDQFVITVQFDGKLIIDGVKEMEYLKDSSVQ